jgi:hypothetical protein
MKQWLLMFLAMPLYAQTKIDSLIPVGLVHQVIMVHLPAGLIPLAAAVEVRVVVVVEVTSKSL